MIKRMRAPRAGAGPCFRFTREKQRCSAVALMRDRSRLADGTSLALGLSKVTAGPFPCSMRCTSPSPSLRRSDSRVGE